jgi:hypothetical protein
MEQNEVNPFNFVEQKNNYINFSANNHEVDIYPRGASTNKKSKQNLIVAEPITHLEQDSDDEDEQILAEQFRLKGYEEAITNHA